MEQLSGRAGKREEDPSAPQARGVRVTREAWERPSRGTPLLFLSVLAWRRGWGLGLYGLFPPLRPPGLPSQCPLNQLKTFHPENVSFTTSLGHFAEPGLCSLLCV